jgi:hypothetical protein
VQVTDGSPQTHKEDGGFDFAGVKVDVDAISHSVQDAVERATRQAETASREIEERIQAAMRRVEEKTRSRTFRMGFEASPSVPPAPVEPVKPVPSAQAPRGRVSEEERRLILQMLAEQKITTDEAVNLLDALEGKNQ